MNLPPPGRTTRRNLLALVAAATAFGAIPRFARAAHVVRPWPAGKPTPALVLDGLDGKPWSLAALKGRPVLLNFWATWCEPCRAEMPSLDRLAARSEKSGLVVLAVNYQETGPVIRHFLDALPLSLPILLDPEGAAAAGWTPRVFPTTVLIDRRGVARQSVIGELDWTGDDADALVAPLLLPSRRA